MQTNKVMNLHSYIRELEDEIEKWNIFREELDKEDLEAFDQLVDACRQYVLPGSKIINQNPLETMIMSILLHQEKNILYIRDTLLDLIPEDLKDKSHPDLIAKVGN